MFDKILFVIKKLGKTVWHDREKQTRSINRKTVDLSGTKCAKQAIFMS